MDKSQEILEKAPGKARSEEYNEFLKGVDTFEKVEDKLRFCIDFMRSSLSKEKTPAFRDFWGAKKLCLDLFKEKINTRSRNLFWNEYVALSEEIRKVKEILDEESAFTHEQIELATSALEKDRADLEALIEALPLIELPKEAKTLQGNQAQYQKMQRILIQLDSFGRQIHALRKELVETPMRMRQKNRQFDKLSKLGDQVFPRRKELIKEISQLFLEDIERFVNGFSLKNPPYFALKDEIRAMQGFAKMITLDSTTFRKSRIALSGCWDKIKEKEDLRREERSLEKDRSKANFEKIAPKIEALKEECKGEKISLSAADQKINEILKEMKELELGPDEVKRLKKFLFGTKKPLEEKEELERIQKEEAAALETKKQEESLGLLSKQILDLLNQTERLQLETLVEKWESLVKEEKTLNVDGLGKELLSNRLGAIEDHIQEKKWKALQEETPQDLVEDLRMILEERQRQRRALKERHDSHRKIAGGSNLSFADSLSYQELIEEEKARLDSIELMIEEIEEKLFD